VALLAGGPAAVGDAPESEDSDAEVAAGPPAD
jgi:hypothetical protein